MQEKWIMTQKLSHPPKHQVTCPARGEFLQYRKLQFDNKSPPKDRLQSHMLSKFRHKKSSTWRDFFHFLVLMWYCRISGERHRYQNMSLTSESSLNMHYYPEVGINRVFRAGLQTFLFRILLAHTYARKHCMTTHLSLSERVVVKVHNKLVIFFQRTSCYTLCSSPVLTGTAETRRDRKQDKGKKLSRACPLSFTRSK